MDCFLKSIFSIELACHDCIYTRFIFSFLYSLIQKQIVIKACLVLLLNVNGKIFLNVIDNYFDRIQFDFRSATVIERLIFISIKLLFFGNLLKTNCYYFD